ncbi:DHHC zinc finger domain protein [Cooperia oncophora]
MGVQGFVAGIKPVAFDPTQHEHVIEKGFCNICQIHVEEKTKHCRRCNVCIEVFDHHCIWLNNCIGKKNYR